MQNSKALAVREGVTSAIKRISPHSSLYSIFLKHGFCAQHYTATHQYVPEQFGSCKHTERPEMLSGPFWGSHLGPENRRPQRLECWRQRPPWEEADSVLFPALPRPDVCGFTLCPAWSVFRGRSSLGWGKSHLFPWDERILV